MKIDIYFVCMYIIVAHIIKKTKFKVIEKGYKQKALTHKFSLIEYFLNLYHCTTYSCRLINVLKGVRNVFWLRAYEM